MAPATGPNRIQGPRENGRQGTAISIQVRTHSRRRAGIRLGAGSAAGAERADAAADPAATSLRGRLRGGSGEQGYDGPGAGAAAAGAGAAGMRISALFRLNCCAVHNPPPTTTTTPRTRPAAPRSCEFTIIQYACG